MFYRLRNVVFADISVVSGDQITVRADKEETGNTASTSSRSVVLVLSFEVLHEGLI